MKFLIVSFFVFAAGLNAHADSLSGWQDLVGKVISQGKSIETMFFETRYLQRVQGEELNYTADYITTAGNVGEDGIYYVQQVAANRETWVAQPDGSWLIDQWLIYLNVNDGTLNSMVHKEIIKTPDGTTKVTTLAPGTFFEQQKFWNQIYQEWLQ